MKIFTLSFPALALGLAAACTSGSGDTGGGGATGGKPLTLGEFDTSCQVDSDCIAVFIGTPACCAMDNAAINKADQASYTAAYAAQGPVPCTEACVGFGAETPVCDQGTCALTVSCGTTTCSAGQVCVWELTEGPGQPQDGGTCPAGEHLSGSECLPGPTYHCASPPSSCGVGPSCDCADSLCDPGYACTGANGLTLQCIASGA
jgi:hypothetical protein